MSKPSYQYGQLPVNIDNTNNNSRERDNTYDGNEQDFGSFQRGLEEMYQNPGNGNYGRWNIYMVGCIFITFLVLLSGTHHRHSTIVSKDNNTTPSTQPNVPVMTPQVSRTTSAPTYATKSEWEPKTQPVVPLPSVPVATPGNEISKSPIQIISLLMAFPMSGVSFTFHLLSSLTNDLTFGTNYAIDSKSPPIFEVSYPNGPFMYPMETNKETNKNAALVMTHCGSHCLDAFDCGGHGAETLWSFDTACRVTKKPMELKEQMSMGLYDRSLVNYNRTIHLVREPLANLVSLFHLQFYMHEKDQVWIKQYPNNKDGFSNWCLDQSVPPEGWSIMGDYLLKDDLKKVPCFFQLFQYVQWHMLTYQLHEGNGHIVHFEDFNHEIDVGKSMLNYLQVQTKDDTTNVPLSFRGANMYKQYYTEKDRQLMYDLIKTISPDNIYQNLFKKYE